MTQKTTATALRSPRFKGGLGFFFKISGLDFGIQGLGFRLPCFGFRVESLAHKKWKHPSSEGGATSLKHLAGSQQVTQRI